MDPRAHSEPLRRLAACPVWVGLDGGTLVVACSGGRDSVALARAAHELLSQASFRERFKKPPVLLLWHLDHGLRDDSPQDAAFVAALGEELGVYTLIEHVNLRERLAHEGGNLEAVARDARYDRLRKLTGADGSPADSASLPPGYGAPVRAMTAHHLGDQAETILHHILRGTHLAGLRGIAAQIARVYRPWLDLAPELLDGYLLQLGQAHCEDSTNYALDRTRNRIRHEVMPLLRELNPRAREHIARLAPAAREARNTVQQKVTQLQVEHFGMLTLLSWLPLTGWPDGKLDAWLNGEDWTTHLAMSTPALAFYCVAMLKERYGQMSYEEQIAIEDWAHDPREPHRIGQFSVYLPEPHLLLIVDADARVGGEPKPLKLTPNLQQAVAGLSVLLSEAEAEQWQAHQRRDKAAHEETRDFGAMLAELCAEQPSELSWHCYLPASISLPLTLRTWREGERIEIAGGGSKTLGDIFTDAKVPVPLRRSWGVLADSEDRAVWLPGLSQGALMQIPQGEMPLWRLILRSGGN